MEKKIKEEIESSNEEKDSSEEKEKKGNLFGDPVCILSD